MYTCVFILLGLTLTCTCPQAAAALQKLLSAVRRLDIAEASRLLKLGAPVNEPNPDVDVSFIDARNTRMYTCQSRCQGPVYHALVFVTLDG